MMMVGTYQFGNSGLDKVNVVADDVTSSRRLRELATLATALAAFRPTRVTVEVQHAGPSYGVPEFATFSPATLTRSRNEIVQIGYRVPAPAHLPGVQGIAEHPAEGEPDHFPIVRVERHAKAPRRQTEQATTSTLRMSSRYDDPETPMGGQDLY